MELKSVYGLTGAEAAMAASLTSGDTVEEIAATRQVSINTVGTQLSVVLRKTETARQAGLVRLV